MSKAGKGQIVIERRNGGKLRQMAKAAGVPLREWLLEQLRKHKNMTTMARELGVTAQRVKIDLSREGIVEVRRYFEGPDGSSAKSVVWYIPEEAVSTPFLPVFPPE